LKTILYIGNKISKHGFNKTSIETLGVHLEQESFTVFYSSDKKMFLFRLLDMMLSVFKYRNKVSYILMDTYSTKAFWYAFICSQIARIFKIKYIPILRGGDLPRRLESNPRLCGMLFNNAFKNIAPSTYLLSEFNKRNYKNVLYIPNSIGLHMYPFKKRTSFVPKLLWVRAFAAIYNPKMAVAVLKNLQILYPNATLTMVGPDKDGSMVTTKQYAKKLGVAVNFTNRLSKEEWINLSKQANFFINTTHFDNTPVSVMEAMALGLPVISTNVGGIPFLLTHNENAILVNDNDVLAMSEAINQLILENEKAQQIAFNARKIVEKMDWKVVKDDWSDLFNS